MNDLIEWLLDYAKKNKIDCELEDLSPDFSGKALPEKSMIIINKNWHNQNEIPFIVGHEIGHLMLGDKGVLYYASPYGAFNEEHDADNFSLALIFQYACSSGNYFVDPGEFIQAYGIPYRMLNETYKLFKENNDLIF